MPFDNYDYEFFLENPLGGIISEYDEVKGVNRPKLAPGMTAVNGMEVRDTISNPEEDTSWYSYTTTDKCG